MGEFTKPLRLVTPHMKGDRVEDAQFLLKGNNRFKDLATYKDGELDGDYGTLTAQATKRAKYWLGYPDSGIDNVFGQNLYEYLNPEIARKLPADYLSRRNQRLKSIDNTICMRAFKYAETQIGYKEVPTNRTKYGQWYGFNGVAWCAIFESYCFAHSGWPNFHFAAVEQIYYNALANRFKLYIVRSPKKGDIIGYQLHGDSFAHTAFFDSWVDDGTLLDLGGNTGPSSISNGGMVMKQNRSKSIVRFYARVVTI